MTIGVDPTIFIAPIRLHLTLGVMRLIEQPPSTRNNMQHAPLPTVAQAVALLRSCHEEVQQALEGKPLQVSFNDLGSFQRHKQACHVLFGVPSDPEGSQGRLKRVCGASSKPHHIEAPPRAVCMTDFIVEVDIIYHRFRNAGYIFDNARDYTLHLTLVNSSHRKPTQRGVKLPKKRIPFDASSLFDTEYKVELGTYVAPECFVSRMDSRDEKGAYVTFGGIPLVPPEAAPDLSQSHER